MPLCLNFTWMLRTQTQIFTNAQKMKPKQSNKKLYFPVLLLSWTIFLPDTHVEGLCSVTYKWHLIWKWSLWKCNQVKRKNVTWLTGRGGHVHRAVAEPGMRRTNRDDTPKSQRTTKTASHWIRNRRAATKRLTQSWVKLCFHFVNYWRPSA